MGFLDYLYSLPKEQQPLAFFIYHIILITLLIIAGIGDYLYGNEDDDFHDIRL